MIVHCKERLSKNQWEWTLSQSSRFLLSLSLLLSLHSFSSLDPLPTYSWTSPIPFFDRQQVGLVHSKVPYSGCKAEEALLPIHPCPVLSEKRDHQRRTQERNCKWKKNLCSRDMEWSDYPESPLLLPPFFLSGLSSLSFFVLCIIQDL